MAGGNAGAPRTLGFPTLAPLPFGPSADVNVKAAPFNAKGDGVTDDTAAIQAAINYAASLSAVIPLGATVVFPPGNYIVSAQILSPQFVWLRGSGTRATVITSSTAGFTFKIGGTSGALAYGCAIMDMAIVLTNTTGGGIWTIETCGALLANLYIEGVVSGGCTAIFMDGLEAASIFNRVDNVIANHVKYGMHVGSTGAQHVTSIDSVGFRALCDLVGGSVGLLIDAGNGQGSRFVGGNFEACAFGMIISGFSVAVMSARFEGNTCDVRLETGADGNYFDGCTNFGVLQDASGVETNTFVGNYNGSRAVFPPNKVNGITSNGDINAKSPANFWLLPNGTASRFLGVNATSTFAGRLWMQAGGGSSGFGGAFLGYGHSHATHPGDVVAGISAGSGGAFRVNNQADDGGTDLLVVSQALGTQAKGKFGANNATPQAAAAVAAAVVTTPSALASFGFTQAQADSIPVLLNQLRAALVANGIAV